MSSYVSFAIEASAMRWKRTIKRTPSVKQCRLRARRRQGDTAGCFVIGRLIESLVGVAIA
jgi:hypothetical protein